jgi:hypothetical protein
VATVRKEGGMTALSAKERDRLAKALGAWGEKDITAAARTRVGGLDLPGGMSAGTVGDVVKHILVELIIGVGALAITFVESRPDWDGTDIQAQAVAAYALDQMAAKSDVLTKSVLERDPDVQRFVNNKASFSREETVDLLLRIDLIKKAVPVVLDLVREAASVAALAVRLLEGLRHPPGWQFWA